MCQKCFAAVTAVVEEITARVVCCFIHPEQESELTIHIVSLNEKHLDKNHCMIHLLKTNNSSTPVSHL